MDRGSFTGGVVLGFGILLKLGACLVAWLVRTFTGGLNLGCGDGEVTLVDELDERLDDLGFVIFQIDDSCLALLH